MQSWVLRGLKLIQLGRKNDLEEKKEKSEVMNTKLGSGPQEGRVSRDLRLVIH